jgi:hypothetical protein
MEEREIGIVLCSRYQLKRCSLIDSARMLYCGLKFTHDKKLLFFKYSPKLINDLATYKIYPYLNLKS